MLHIRVAMASTLQFTWRTKLTGNLATDSIEKSVATQATVDEICVCHRSYPGSMVTIQRQEEVS